MLKLLGLSTRLSVGSCLAVAAICLPVGTGAIQQSVQKDVSAVTMAAAGSDPELFARALAMDRVPALFIIAEEVVRLPIDAGERSRITEAGDEASLGNAVARFSNTHKRYNAELRNGAVLVKPLELGQCTDAVNRVLPQMALAGSAHEVLWQIAKLVDSTVPTEPSSIVCGGQCGPDDERMYLTPVQLVLDGNDTLADALADLSRQAPGIVLMVRQKKNRDGRGQLCQLGYYGLKYRFDTSYTVK